MILTGKTLGKRQLELNTKVNEAAAKKVKFDDVKEQIEKSDVDKLFKIDLASKYKNIDYIIEVLKSGDSLYISRALKCIWIYDDKLSNIINPEYLHDHIFPHVSIKMKKKILASLPLYVRNEDRAASFYTYCMNTNKTIYANKFLPFTSTSFKKDVIENNINFCNSIEPKILRFVIGNSFELADLFLSKTLSKNTDLFNLRYLYSASDEKYLELLEKHAYTCSNGKDFERVGLRLSKNIIKSHKDRIMKNPVVYVNILNKHALIKHSSIDALKTYAVGLLPDTSEKFWSMYYCRTYEYILNAIPAEERFEFTKKIFTTKYQESYDMNKQFYDQECYKYMTIYEREKWALRHLASNKDLLGVGNNYIWYKYINFDTAFPEIKKYILITPDSDKRADIVKVLIESVRNQRDLEKLLNYYYERHVNEVHYQKQRFLERVTEVHNVFDFDENCWEAFNKLLYSLEVYNPLDKAHNNVYQNRIMAMVYYIINNKEFPTGLQQYVDSVDNAFVASGIMFHHARTYFDQLDKKRKEILYQYVIKHCVQKLTKFENQEYNNDVKYEVRDRIEMILSVMSYFEKPKEDCPEIVKKFMKLDPEKFYSEKPKCITPAYLSRLLKQDALQVVTELPLIKHNIENNREFKLNLVLKKLRIYFWNDIAKDYLNFLIKYLSAPESDQRIIFTAVFGIFHLADNTYKSDFMSKYAPEDSKINHRAVDRTLLYIQEAICRFVCYSRPPVPLSNVSIYIKGDYLRYCLPMINSYSVNLPLTLSMRFIESLLNSPVSVQKHGLRLVFRCFDTENLKKLLLNAWTRTKNVSLRKVIYTSLYNHMIQQNKMEQVKLYETLKMFALSVHQDDDKDVLNVLATGSNLHDSIKGDYLETAWITINKLTDNTVNLNYKVAIVNNIERHIEFMSTDVLRKILDEHVNTMLIENHIQPNQDRDHFEELSNAKWQLIAKYIVKYVEDPKNIQTVLEFVKIIVKKCMEMWNDVHFNHKINAKSYTLRKFFHKFVDRLMVKHYDIGKASYTQINPVLEAILADLRITLPIHERYRMEWFLQLAIITNKVFDEGKVLYCDSNKNKNIIMKEIVNKYALELGNLVKDFVDKQLFFSSYVCYISDMIKDNLNNIVNISEPNYHYTVRDDMSVFVGIGLMNFKMVETVLIAIRIMPVLSSSKSDSLVSSTQYKDLVNGMKMFDNKEIQCLYNEKFMSNNFMKDLY